MENTLKEYKRIWRIRQDYLAVYGENKPVAEQIEEFIIVKNPPNCVGGTRVIIRAGVLFCLLTAPYEIHSSQCNCLRVNSWSSTNQSTSKRAYLGEFSTKSRKFFDFKSPY